jgi:GT2 family glycosyltransferase
MNGNVVLVPAAVRQNVGALDSDFSHNMADLDYGYRASSAGWNVVLASHFVGYCESNTSKARWKDPSLGLRARWAAINSFRGLPVGEWFKFTRRHCGWRWPRYFVSPYVRCLTCGVRGDRARRS